MFDFARLRVGGELDRDGCLLLCAAVILIGTGLLYPYGSLAQSAAPLRQSSRLLNPASCPSSGKDADCAN
jgi:hypothetical protein